MPQEYEYIKATVDGPDLSLKYKLVGNTTVGCMDCDEDVEDMTGEEIRDLIVELLDVENQRDVIEVYYV